MVLSDSLKEKIAALPMSPGVYIMRDNTGAIIYIGKAVSLKNRVKQYFNNSPKLVKVQAMVDNIADFSYIICLSEKDALTVEANLIRKHKPKYNILLKDDKHSPYIKIDTREKFPTIEVVRRIKKDGAKYFGPYFNGVYVWDIVSVIRSAYRMRTCPKKLQTKARECLNYHIELCLAPCCAHISSEDYAGVVAKVIAFLSGRDDTAEKLIASRMAQAAESEEFERAITYRNQLEMLKKLKERTVANLGAIFDLDIFSYVTNGEFSAVSVVIVRGGKMMGARNYSITDASLSASDALTGFITQYYGSGEQAPPEICLQIEFDTSALEGYLASVNGKRVDITFPKIGAKKNLLKMAEDNARDYLDKSIDKETLRKNMTTGACDALAKILGLAGIRRIECYDISNISGVDKVASEVVFINGEASRGDYRKYKIKTVEGANDFACMAEVIARRFSRLKDGDDKFADAPDLIVIDGGAGQLRYAHESMLSAGVTAPMISLAERDEEIYTLGNSEPIVLPRDNMALKLLIRARDEAHRFAITYHKTARKSRYVSILESVPNVGAVKCKILLAAFPNFADLKTADVATLSAIKGIDGRTAQSVFDFFKRENA